MIITVGSTKGGIGKSTVAVNLAVACADIGNKSVLLIDADVQGSATSFRTLRPSELPHIQLVGMTTGTIHEDIQGFSNYDVIIIDVGGRDGRNFRSAIMACDFLIVPLQPSPYDVWALEDTFSVVSEIQIVKNIIPKILFNMVISTSDYKKEVDPILDQLREKYNFNIFNSTLGHRMDFKKSIAEGKGVIEFSPKSKADNEMRAIFKEVFNNENAE